MRYLIIHNRYSKIGGEESVVAQQIDLLRNAGHDVVLFERSYSEIESWKFSKLSSFCSAIYNRKSVKQVKSIINDFRPEVAIVHNLFPVISPAVLPVLRKNGVRVLMTVHNYRLICPTGLFFTNGSICESCGNGIREFNCLRKKCQGTFFGSFAFSVRSFWARVTKKYTKNVDLFLVLSDFQRNKLIEYGICGEKIAVIPNFYQPQQTKYESLDEENYVAFVGRLSVEKGVDFLFELANKMPDVEFRVAGEKSDNVELSKIPNNVKLVGYLSKTELEEFYKKSAIVISTSLCYEGFSLSVIEAMYFGKCVLVPNVGVFPMIVDDGQCGLLYEKGNLSDAVNKLYKALQNKALRSDIGKSAHKKVVDHYNAENYLKLMISASYKN